MQVKENFSLKKHNTFGIDAKARFFAEIQSVSELKELLAQPDYPNKFILGGGSNMLITKDIDALVIYVNLKGITIVSQDENEVTIKAMAGENWHQFVLWTLDRDYGGLENMSLIPGNTGTAPIQNIGAYGSELKDCFLSCETIHRATQNKVVFLKKDCKFGYRDSYFKNEGKDQYVITSITLKLTRKDHTLNMGYGTIKDELQKNNIAEPTIRDISNAVIAIRNSKLPNPNEIGNSGSFFKNPVVSRAVFEKFIKENPKAPYYGISDSEYKIPAGWLIEQCGFKGKRYGDVGIHKKQALVLINHGNASGKEIFDLAKKIIHEVYTKFGISIIPEVNIIK
ncbi:UDP-N-acetylmuramate dehydrogenase [Maribacter sp. 2304DJ31-5]|uniref:UDP-N-acetylmuramate dehydrogenase n=1 Tax=Maribacter sp. 2304DJ31-5 TaxID=3386273 RepID=UPI0039BCF65B